MAEYELKVVLTTGAVALRFWSRLLASKAGFWWDDWLALLSLFFYWGLAAVTIWWVKIGLGEHITQLPASHQSSIGLALFVDDLVYNSGITSIKLSVLMFYVRIFHKIRSYRIAFWVMGAIIVSWDIAVSMMAIFTCIPVQAAWISSIHGRCLDYQSTFLGTAVSNIIIDVLLLILPMPMLWKLNINTRRKIALVGVFAAGYCTVILSILRTVSVTSVAVNQLKLDLSFNVINPQFFIVCEEGIALISCCLPAIFNLIKFAIRTYFPEIGEILSPTELLSAAGGSKIRPTGNPTNSYKDFVKLQNLDKRSRERLFEGANPGVHFANITSEAHAEDQTIDYSERAFDDQQIHVRSDIDIEDGRTLDIRR